MTPEALDLACWPIFTEMTARGIAVDVGRLEALRDKVAGELEAQEAALGTYASCDLNPYSPSDVAAWLAGEGLAGRRRTRGGAVATDERALSGLLDVHPVPGCVLECRGLRKLLSTFIEPVLTRVAPMREPAVHPRWRLTKVKSGRPSMEDPNLLAFPTREALGKAVRACFVARPGHRLVSIDFGQIEPRVAAVLSGDETLLRVFADGRRDLYADMARRLFRLAGSDADFGREPMKTRYRQPAKIILLGCVLYGMGPERLYEELIRWGCGEPSTPIYSLEACEDFVRRRHEPYPGLGMLEAQVALGARRDAGWVATAGGRRRFLPALLCDGRRWPASKLREEAERQAFNHVIQGTAQEITKYAMLRVAAAAIVAYPLLQIYDEMVYEVPEAHVGETAARLAAEMGQYAATAVCAVDIPTSYSVSDSWGGLK